MKEDTLEETVKRSMAVIETLPASQRNRLLALVAETRERHREIQESTRRSLDALDDWRLLRKYVQFDLEARMREAARRRGSSNGGEEE